MKRMLLVLGIGVLLVPCVRAQGDHVEVGVFADYFRLDQTNTNFAGVGARGSFQLYKEIKLEGEMSYDFNQAFNEGFTDPTTTTITVARTNLRTLHGEFGPRVNIGHHAIQPFVFVKGGFMNFRIDPAPATVGTFISSVSNLRASDVSPVLYPGGGLQAHLGPIGLRLDVGDEMYFNNGAHHNLRVAFGPVFRF